MTTNTSTREDWLTARRDLLAGEKAFAQARENLAVKRRALPRYRIGTPYVFQTPAGQHSLPELFGRHTQLIVYHFMFGPDWEQGCKSCSFWADSFNGSIGHLSQRDAGLVCVSSAPLEKLLAFRRRMGWSFDWVSSAGTSFNNDFGVTGLPGETLLYNFDKHVKDAGELPGLSVFARNDGEVYHTYSCYARGLDMINCVYQLLDLVPKGRDEADLPYTMSWVKHHDKYEEQTS